MSEPRRSAVRPFVEAFEAHRFQIARHARPQTRRCNRLLRAQQEQRVEWTVRQKRRPAGQQRIEDRPQAVHVGRRTDLVGPAVGLLWRHERRSTQNLARLGCRGGFRASFARSGQAEVGDAQSEVQPILRVLRNGSRHTVGQRLKNDVARFQVAMQDPAQCACAIAPASATTIRAASRGATGPSRSLSQAASIALRQ